MGGAITDPEIEGQIVIHVKKAFEGRIEEAKSLAAMAKRGLRTILKVQDPQTLTFRVTLNSLWVDHGEQSVTVERQGPLAEVMLEAITTFLKVNHRSDVQARYAVWVVFPNKNKDKPIPNVQVPEGMWQEFKWKAPGDTFR